MGRPPAASPSKWRAAIAAHLRRDEGFDLDVGGVMTWDEDTERPPFDLPPDAAVSGSRFPFDDYPLFDDAPPAGEPRFGGIARIGNGFEEAATPLGTIRWRYQLNAAAGVPEVVFTGSDAAVAIALQSLAAANGGMNVTEFNELLFPFSNAFDFVHRIVDPSSFMDLANASGFFVRVNPATLLHEVVFTRANEHHARGIRTPEVGYIRPGQILTAWRFALRALAEVQRPVEFFGDADATFSSIVRALRHVLREAAPNLPSHVLRDIPDETVLPARAQGLPGVWHAQAGLVFDPAARTTRPVLRLYTGRPVGWGSISDLTAGSDMIELQGPALPSDGTAWEMRVRGAIAQPERMAMELLERLGPSHQLAPTSEALSPAEFPPETFADEPGEIVTGDTIETLPRIADAAALEFAPPPAIEIADSPGPLPPFVPSSVRFGADALAHIPMTPEGLDLLLQFGGTMNDEELDRAFPDPVGQARRTIAWIEGILQRHPQPWMQDGIREHALAPITQALSAAPGPLARGLARTFSRGSRNADLRDLQRALETVMPELLRYEEQNLESVRRGLRRQEGLGLSDEMSGTVPPRVRAAHLDRVRLALAGEGIGVGILAGIAQEVGQQGINVGAGTYSFSPRTTFDSPETRPAMQAIARNPHLAAVAALFLRRTRIRDPITFLQFLEFEVGVQLDPERGFAPRSEWLAWAKLRDDALWAVPNRDDILGDRAAEHALVHEAIGLLTGPPPPPGPQQGSGTPPSAGSPLSFGGLIDSGADSQRNGDTPADTDGPDEDGMTMAIDPVQAATGETPAWAVPLAPLPAVSPGR